MKVNVRCLPDKLDAPLTPLDFQGDIDIEKLLEEQYACAREEFGRQCMAAAECDQGYVFNDEDNVLIVLYAEGGNSSMEILPEKSDRINRSGCRNTLKIAGPDGSYCFYGAWSREETVQEEDEFFSKGILIIPTITGQQLAMEHQQDAIVGWIEEALAPEKWRRALSAMNKTFMELLFSTCDFVLLQNQILAAESLRNTSGLSRAKAEILSKAELTMFVLDKCWCTPLTYVHGVYEHAGASPHSGVTPHRSVWEGLSIVRYFARNYRLDVVLWLFETNRVARDSDESIGALFDCAHFNAVDGVKQLVAAGVPLATHFSLQRFAAEKPEVDCGCVSGYSACVCGKLVSTLQVNKFIHLYTFTDLCLPLCALGSYPPGRFIDFVRNLCVERGYSALPA